MCNSLVDLVVALACYTDPLESQAITQKSLDYSIFDPYNVSVFIS